MSAITEQELKAQLSNALNENYTLRKELRNLKNQVRQLQEELSHAPTRIVVHTFEKPKDTTK